MEDCTQHGPTPDPEIYQTVKMPRCQGKFGDVECEDLAKQAMQTVDPVEHPSHYTRLNPEPLDVIEAWNCSYHVGNVIKYLARAGHKGSEIEDLRKAAYYLDRHIAIRERKV